MEYHLTLTGLQDATGARTAGGLDVVYTKLAVDLQNLAGGPDDPVLAAALETLRDETACDAIGVLLLDPPGRRIGQVIAARVFQAMAAANIKVQVASSGSGSVASMAIEQLGFSASVTCQLRSNWRRVAQ